MKIIIKLIFSFFVEPFKAVRTLIKNGYINIHVTGLEFFADSEGVAFTTNFEATSPKGFFTKGSVVSNKAHDNTIRLN